LANHNDNCRVAKKENQVKGYKPIFFETFNLEAIFNILIFGVSGCHLPCLLKSLSGTSALAAAVALLAHRLQRASESEGTSNS